MKKDVPHIRKPMTPEMKAMLGTLRTARKIAENIRIGRNKPAPEEPTTPEAKPIYLLPPSWNGKEWKLYRKTHNL